MTLWSQIQVNMSAFTNVQDDSKHFSVSKAGRQNS
jgi:hypothetical protein